MKIFFVFSWCFSLFSPILVDPETKKCLAVWSATYRKPFFFSLGFLSLEKGSPKFEAVVDKDTIVLTTIFKAVNVELNLAVNDHSHFQQQNCDCHRLVNHSLRLV